VEVVAGVAAGLDGTLATNRCFGVEECLDCGCAQVDPDLEVELGQLPTLGLSAPVVQALARPLRATLPTVQPPHGHLGH
jgi:hypothetical protein